MVVEVSVGTAELLFDGECRMVVGLACAVAAVGEGVAKETRARSSSMLSVWKGAETVREREGRDDDYGNARRDWMYSKEVLLLDLLKVRGTPRSSR